HCGTVKTVPYGEVKTSSEEEVAFPKEMTEEGFQKPPLSKGGGPSKMVEGFNKVESLKLKVESDFDMRK
ncbi:MAG: hypothetical protein IJ945_05060, partial [Oscillospiraceae bacterium]|nr:hypothetical protein [Oscillospiraceae bacterium]